MFLFQSATCGWMTLWGDLVICHFGVKLALTWRSEKRIGKNTWHIQTNDAPNPCSSSHHDTRNMRLNVFRIMALINQHPYLLENQTILGENSHTSQPQAHRSNELPWLSTCFSITLNLQMELWLDRDEVCFMIEGISAFGTWGNVWSLNRLIWTQQNTIAHLKNDFLYSFRQHNRAVK